MLIIIGANGAALKTSMTVEEFLLAIQNAAPSSWIQVPTNELGTIMLNTFTVAYIYENEV